jgi:hypothetical protein
MLELLLKLIDQLRKLADKKEMDRQKYFDLYVRPAYEASKAIYTDYRSILLELRGLVDKADDPEPIVDFLEKRREALLPARDSLRALVALRIAEGRGTRFEAGVLGLMAGARTAVDARYLDVLDYEEGGYIRARVGPHAVRDVVRIVKARRGDFLSSKPEIRNAVDYELTAIERAWQYVVAGYVELQAENLPGPKVNRKEVLSRSAGVAKLRSLLAQVREMPTSKEQDKYDRVIGEEVQHVAALDVPEVLFRAQKVRETVHDLNAHDPNIPDGYLEEVVSALERDLDAIEARDAAELSGAGHTGAGVSATR